MVPRTATVGVVTSDENVYNEIMAAIGTGSIDHVRNVAAYWAAPVPQPEATQTPDAVQTTATPAITEAGPI